MCTLGKPYGSGRNEVTNRFMSAFWYLDWLGIFAEQKYSGFCRQSLIGGNYGLLQNKGKLCAFFVFCCKFNLGGKYLLNPDYYAALLFSKTMKGKVLTLTNSLDSTIHQYGTIRQNGNFTTGVTIMLLNYRNYGIDVVDSISDTYSKYIYSK